ncbi:uncharacterized protein [Choristoneura fumiferana]|uniref:uncharacterized protein n=1 Tax=Choristoneura fumiferana TaxID=7141 RepID=UPI003D15B4A7
MAKSPLESKLSILKTKEERILRRFSHLLDLSKNVSTFDSRSNENFMAESETIDDFRVNFEKILDEINAISMSLDPKHEPDYETLDTFEDLYARIKRTRANISKITAPQTSSPSAPAPQVKGPNIKLPPIDLPSFDGRTENWPIFYESFKSNIHNNDQLTDSQRVQYLMGKLTHSALNITAGLVPTGETYSIIWDSLVNKYQDKRALGTYYLNNILDIKPSSNSPSSLNSFIERYSATVAALKQLDIPDLSDFFFLQCALRKTDQQTLQSFEMSVRDVTIPSYEQYVTFMQSQVKILERSGNNPSMNTPRTAYKPAANTPAQPARTTYKAFVASNDVPSSSSANNKTCVLCNNNDHLYTNASSSSTAHAPTASSGAACPRAQPAVPLPREPAADAASIGRDPRRPQPLAPVLIRRLTGVGLTSRPIHGYVYFNIESRIYPNNKYYIHALVVDCITDQLPSHFIEYNEHDMAYLNNIPLADLTWNIPGCIDVVLGVQLFPYIYLGNRVDSGSCAPPAFLTAFGYVLMGDYPCKSDPSNAISFTAHVLNDLESSLNQFWELEEIPFKRHLSPEETKCENLYTTSVSRNEEGRYTVALPFCKDSSELGNSRSVAHRRLLYLEKKFKQMPTLRDSYNKVISEYMHNGYLTEIPESELTDDGYYIPHHAVIRPEKVTSPVRVVLDASAKTHSDLLSPMWIEH